LRFERFVRMSSACSVILTCPSKRIPAPLNCIAETASRPSR